MRILTVDPGFQNLGWALCSVDNNELVLEVCDFGNDVLTTDASSDIKLMYNAVSEWCSDLEKRIGHFRIDKILIERSFYDRRPATNWLSYTLAILETCLYSVLSTKFIDEQYDWNPDTEFLSGSVMKRKLQITTGTHAGNKIAILDYIKTKNKEHPKLTNHVADCLGIAVYYLSKLRNCHHGAISIRYTPGLFC